MKRILLVLTVALVMAALVVVTAAPAFAKKPGPSPEVLPQPSGAFADLLSDTFQGSPGDCRLADRAVHTSFELCFFGGGGSGKGGGGGDT